MIHTVVRGCLAYHLHHKFTNSCHYNFNCIFFFFNVNALYSQWHIVLESYVDERKTTHLLAVSRCLIRVNNYYWLFIGLSSLHFTGFKRVCHLSQDPVCLSRSWWQKRWGKRLFMLLLCSWLSPCGAVLPPLVTCVTVHSLQAFTKSGLLVVKARISLSFPENTYAYIDLIELNFSFKFLIHHFDLFIVYRWSSNKNYEYNILSAVGLLLLLLFWVQLDLCYRFKWTRSIIYA